jgi:mannose-6-phosphate isomerase
MESSASDDSHRPWGFYRVLEEGAQHAVKRIQVEPGRRLSLQSHELRAEHWLVVTGEAIVVINGQEVSLRAGDSIDIPRRSQHRIGNPGSVPLVFIEVQYGEYFGEDDIQRFEDDFGRA